ncbi:MAG TPA: AmmeMemoRadiSam system protein B, partial [Spirochaetota bacterium]|nr:AmmeMemoRadiSam system protein B [Spirochaetota bacterium]
MGGNAIQIKKIILSFLLLILLFGCQKPLTVKSYYDGDKPMWEHINNAKSPVEFKDVPKGVIIPHHAITSTYVASFYNGLSKKINPKTIFLLCPNHFETGENPIITGNNLVFKTVYGELKTNNDIVNELVKKRLATINNKSFIKEHGVFFHAPFIKKYFPDAKIVPILQAWKNSKEENDKIADFIQKYLNRDGFVIASVDFSHYQIKSVADFHDETSFTVIT